MTKTVRVGNASGYWGDDPDALERQLVQGRLHYVTLDFLAEVTMSILQKQRSRNTELGYATDFVHQMRKSLPHLKGTQTRMITNAGGLNPLGCAQQIERMAGELGVRTKVAVITGDDLMDQLDQLLAKGIPLKNMETGAALSSIREHIQSANAYLGAAPILQALEKGADIIITGRVADAALAVAAPVFEFGWSLEDWDRLASSIVAGHILECGAQASGGNLTDWREVPSLLDIGYPIAEFLDDGTFHVTKHEGTGGLVSCKTVTEQLLYEIGDPRDYRTPDAVADFSSIVLSEEAQNRVKVSGVRGKPRPDSLKVSISYHDGYKAQGTLIVTRPDAVEKSRRLADLFWTRLGLEFEETSTELVGYNSCHRHLVAPFDPPEILLRLSARDTDREKLEEFAGKLPSLLLSATPSVALVGAWPRIQEVVAYWPCMIPAQEITPEVAFLSDGKKLKVAWTPPPSITKKVDPKPFPPPQSASRRDHGAHVRVPLTKLCYARNGDKGDTCNIGVVARSRKIYPWLCRELTAPRVKEYFGEMSQGEVKRFELPNLQALNFLLQRSLGGGGTVSLRIDPQGKTLAAALLMMEVDVPQQLLPEGFANLRG